MWVGRSRGNCRGLKPDSGKNSKVEETKFDEGFLLGNKAELVSMEECWYQPRGKGFEGKLCVGRQITGPIHK